MKIENCSSKEDVTLTLDVNAGIYICSSLYERLTTLTSKKRRGLVVPTKSQCARTSCKIYAVGKCANGNQTDEIV